MYYMLVRPGARPAPSGPGYYYGPMKSKGNPNLYGDDDGKRVPKPPEAVAAETKPVPRTDDNAPATAPTTVKPGTQGGMK